MEKKINDINKLLINDMTILYMYIKNSYIWHIILTAVFGLVSVCFISYQNLNMYACATVMEVYAIFTGVFLFAPILFPEQDKAFFSLEKTKAYSITRIIILRILFAALLTFIAICLYIIAFENGNSELDVAVLIRCSFVEFVYLGSIAFAVSAITEQIVFGYMVSTIYYLFCMGSGKKYLGPLALFQMRRGAYDDWKVMFVIAVFIFYIPMIGNILKQLMHDCTYKINN